MGVSAQEQNQVLEEKTPNNVVLQIKPEEQKMRLLREADRKKCKGNERKNKKGNCVPRKRGRSTNKCPENKKRNNNGKCVSKKRSRTAKTCRKNKRNKNGKCLPKKRSRKTRKCKKDEKRNKNGKCVPKNRKRMGKRGKGFNQAIELAAESLANVKFIQEKKLIGRYFDEISQDTGKYCFGVDDTLKALE